MCVVMQCRHIPCFPSARPVPRSGAVPCCTVTLGCTLHIPTWDMTMTICDPHPGAPVPESPPQGPLPLMYTNGPLPCAGGRCGLVMSAPHSLPASHWSPPPSLPSDWLMVPPWSPLAIVVTSVPSPELLLAPVMTPINILFLFLVTLLSPLAAPPSGSAQLAIPTFSPLAPSNGFIMTQHTGAGSGSKNLTIHPGL